MATYLIIFLVLLVLELVYFKVADHYNIIDKPNERSSHSTIVLRGGGIIFAISMVVWYSWFGCASADSATVVVTTATYLPFLCGLIMVAGVSFVDDIKSLPDSVRLVVQIVAMVLMLYPIINGVGFFSADNWIWGVLLFFASLIVCVALTNIINFMDGINGITAGYSLAVLIPLLILDKCPSTGSGTTQGFIEESYFFVRTFKRNRNVHLVYKYWMV